MKIKVLGKYVESGPAMKLLSVSFDEHLKFTSHLIEWDELSKSISRKIGFLMRLKKIKYQHYYQILEFTILLFCHN